MNRVRVNSLPACSVDLVLFEANRVMEHKCASSHMIRHALSGACVARSAVNCLQ